MMGLRKLRGGLHMKRLLAPTMLAALVGAAVASAAALFIGTGSGTSPEVHGTSTQTQASAGATAHEVADAAPTASQIYQRDSTGVVAIKAVSANGEDEGTGIVLN